MEDNDDYDEEDDAVVTPSRVSVFPKKSPQLSFSPNAALPDISVPQASKKSQHPHLSSAGVEGLTKAQLKTALLYLLEVSV
ncbi:unnamed protein product [Dibothriocephalus latus]|uniref:Uncharacterized protein n=1 Tax=Dibothriocephalus latus TaxID=60516 RepID=A0A3P7LEV5_DIBLA|nr:unnamed protein product [Dibothriocephalus latus]